MLKSGQKVDAALLDLNIAGELVYPVADALAERGLPHIFVTGYGTKSAHNQYSRWYAHQLDSSLPTAPVGTLASGPVSPDHVNAGTAGLIGDCAPMTCYIDDNNSWSTNELCIYWNAPLALISAWLEATA